MVWIIPVDEFLVLDKNRPGLFVTHQGSICMDFAEFASSPLLNIDSDYFREIRNDFRNINQTGEILSENECVKHPLIDVNVVDLNETQLEYLSKTSSVKIRLQIQKEIPDLPLQSNYGIEYIERFTNEFMRIMYDSI